MWMIAASARSTSSNASYHYTSSSSSEGKRSITQGTTAFAGSDSALSANETNAMPNAWLVPSIAGAVSVGFNLPGIFVAPEPGENEKLNSRLRIPREVLADIFLGRIRQWSALAPWNPPLAGVDRNITLIVRSESSGTTDAFTGALSSFSPAWKALVGRSSLPKWPQPEGMNVIKAEGNAGVALQLKLNRYSIGYLSQVDAELYGVTSASIQNKAGEFIAPSLQAVQSAMDTFETELSVLGGSGSKSFFLSIADPPDTSAKSYPIAMLSYFVFDVAKLACDQLRDILFLIYWCVMLQRCAACCIRPAFGLLHLACCTLRAGHGRTPRRRRLRPAGASPLSVRKLQRSSSRRCGGLNV
jgi:phosphate transport system substrate-binding protein